MKPRPLPPGHDLVQRGGCVYIRCVHGVESLDKSRTPECFWRDAPLSSEKWIDCAACAAEASK